MLLSLALLLWSAMLKTLLIILEQSMIYLPVALGAYISFSLLKVPDLSLETSYLMGAFFAGLALQWMHGWEYQVLSLLFACGAGLFGGMLVGVVSSSITYFGAIPHLLSSIITFGLFNGIFLFFSNPYVSLARFDNVLMLAPYIEHHPELVALLAINIFFIFVGWYLLRTQLGYSFAIFGYNPEFFRHFGIATSYVFMTGIILASGMAGLAGFFFAQTNNLIDLNMGIGKSLFCITALILGKVIMQSKKASIFIPVIGVLVYFTLQQILLKVGFNLKYFTMIQSLLVLLVLVTLYKNNRAAHDQLGV